MRKPGGEDSNGWGRVRMKWVKRATDAGVNLVYQQPYEWSR